MRVLAAAAALAFGLAVNHASAQSVRISEASLPATLTIGETQLSLTGCGVREALFMEIYVAALYLPRAGMTRAAILSEDTPKAIRAHIVYGGDLGDGIPESWRESLREIASEGIRRDLNELYDRLDGGDEVTIGYAPGAGTTVLLNGQQVSAEPNDRLMHTLLQLWIGERAVSKNLRRLLLRQTCEGDDGPF